MTNKEILIKEGFELDTYRGESKNYKYLLEYDTRTKQYLYCNLINDDFRSCWVEEDQLKFGHHSEITLSNITSFENFMILFKLLKFEE